MTTRDQIIEKQDEINKYAKHKSFCNITANWDEAIQAMGDTPEKFRDESWNLAYNEMREKMKICNCGLNKLESELSALKSQLSKEPEISDEDIMEWIQKQFIETDFKDRFNESEIVKSFVKDGMFVGAKAMRDGKIPISRKDNIKDK